MRFFRVTVLAAVVSVAALQSSAAQDGRQFSNAWFWGVKAGGLLYSSEGTNHGGAPIVGGEWLITRSSGGLYLSIDQAFLKTSGGFVDRDPDSTSLFVRSVSLKNLRRFNAVAMAFPMASQTRHPYVGVGFSLSQIGDATLGSNPTNASRFLAAQDSIQSRRASFSPMFIGGVQWRFRPASFFTQVLASPNQDGFFLSRLDGSGMPLNFSFELGVRYNVGSSIDKNR